MDRISVKFVSHLRLVGASMAASVLILSACAPLPPGGDATNATHAQAPNAASAATPHASATWQRRNATGVGPPRRTAHRNRRRQWLPHGNRRHPAQAGMRSQRLHRWHPVRLRLHLESPRDGASPRTRQDTQVHRNPSSIRQPSSCRTSSTRSCGTAISA